MDVALYVTVDGGYDISYSVVPKHINDWVLDESTPGRKGAEPKWTPIDVPKEITDQMTSENCIDELRFDKHDPLWMQKLWLASSFASIVPAGTYSLLAILNWIKANNHQIVDTIDCLVN